jgi:hypothetical protein
MVYNRPEVIESSPPFIIRPNRKNAQPPIADGS